MSIEPQDSIYGIGYLGTGKDVASLVMGKIKD